MSAPTVSLIALNDVRVLFERLRDGAPARVLGNLLKSSDGRVRAAWSRTDRPPSSWKDIPAVRLRCNRIITGDPAMDFEEYVALRYLSVLPAPSVVSLGCGTGRRERRLARLLPAASIVGIDLSPTRVAAARHAADQEGVSGRVEFRVGDATRLGMPPGAADAVIVEDALHHLAPLQRCLSGIAALLRPGGILVVNEFVGPSRFQWTDQQLRAATALLETLPPAYRTTPSGRPRRPPHRPGILTMVLSDPSEAVESAQIAPLLRESLEVLEWKPYGGTVLHLVLKDLAHHFLKETEESRRLLAGCFAFEDRLLASGELPSDFLFAVCRTRRTGKRGMS